MPVIFDIKRFAVHDGPGIRTTIFFKGCPLSCLWCHNPESQATEPQTAEVEHRLNGKSIFREKTYGREESENDIMGTILRDRIFYEESGGGVTFSGGEPMMQINALEGLLLKCREEGLHTVIDTSGQASPDHFERVLDHTDLFLYDLKNIDSGLHRSHTGADNSRILSNADYLLGKGAKLIFRIPVIPEINATGSERDRLFAFVQERAGEMEEVHLLPYHRIADHKYLRLGMKRAMENITEPGEGFMNELKLLFETTGLKVRIGG